MHGRLAPQVVLARPVRDGPPPWQREERPGKGARQSTITMNSILFHYHSISFHRADVEEIAIYLYVLDMLRGSFGMIPKNMSNDSERSFGMIPPLPRIRFQRMWRLSSTHEV
jgi:hypothetical protein